MMRFIGALLLTYFVSRLLRRLGLRPPSVAKLTAAHVLSLAILALVVIALRAPADAYHFGQLWVYIIAQLIWLMVDYYRAQVAFWKPPVTVTESSPTTRGASSR